MGVGRTDTMEDTSEEYSDSEEYDGESSSYSDSDVDGVDEHSDGSNFRSARNNNAPARIDDSCRNGKLVPAQWWVS